MSGPKTTSYILDNSLISIANLVGSAREAVELSWRRLDEERRRIAEERKRRFEEQSEMLEQGELRWRADRLHEESRRLLAEIRAAQAEFPDLSGISLQVAPPPLGGSIKALGDYIAAVSNAVVIARTRMTAVKGDIGRRRALDSWLEDAGNEGERPRTVADVLSDVGPNGGELGAGAEGGQIDSLREGIAVVTRHFLERYHVMLPEDIGNKIRNLYKIQDESAAVALGSAIRQGLAQAEAEMEEERAEAQRLLQGLDGLSGSDPGLQPARERLHDVLAGKDPLTDALRESVKSIHQRHAAEARRRDEQAAAILGSALKDLGYDVAPITETLFVDGGMVYFRKQEWGNGYAVRMRIDTLQNTMNFNVIRLAVGKSAASAAQKGQDVAIENAWCGQFDHVLAVMRDRGINTNITRRTKPGALPVLTVNSETVNTALGEFLEHGGVTEATRVATVPKTRKMRDD